MRRSLIGLLFLGLLTLIACSDDASSRRDTGHDLSDAQTGDQGAGDQGAGDLASDLVDAPVDTGGDTADGGSDDGGGDAEADVSGDTGGGDDGGLGGDVLADLVADRGDAAYDAGLADVVDADAGPELVVLDGFVPDDETVAGTDTVTATRSWALRIVPGESAVAAVRLSAQRTADDGSLSIRIETDSDGLPSGAIIARDASSSIPATSFPSTANTDLATAEFRISVPVSDAVHWVVLSTSAGAEASEYVFTQYNVDSSGNMAFRDGEGAWALYDKSYDWIHEVVGYR